MQRTQQENADLTKKIQDLSQEIEKVTSTIIQTQSLQELENALSEIQHIHRSRSTLIEDYKQQQLRYKQVSNQEKIASDLYTIFSKELLLLVLEDSMQVLGEIMNNFLARVVDFQIAFVLDKEKGEKVELQVHILDNK